MFLSRVDLPGREPCAVVRGLVHVYKTRPSKNMTAAKYASMQHSILASATVARHSVQAACIVGRVSLQAELWQHYRCRVRDETRRDEDGTGNVVIYLGTNNRAHNVSWKLEPCSSNQGTLVENSKESGRQLETRGAWHTRQAADKSAAEDELLLCQISYASRLDRCNQRESRVN